MPRCLRRPGFLFVASLLCAGGAAAAAEPASPDPASDLTSLGIEAVMNLEVTSVSKKSERLMDAPAAIQVITGEDIRRSGATTLPDLLRLVPGVQVARVNSSSWAVGVRGFTSTLSRSLLVLMDGRSVYSPLFAGTYWDVQDTPLNDIERIEVIRGPGATLWGANAVNGVINVITKSAGATQGGYASLRAGNEERAVATARFGGRSSGGAAFRVYGKYTDRDAQFHQNGDDFDDWHMALAGFRADADRGHDDHLTLQGDVYQGKAGQRSFITSYSPPFGAVVEKDADLSGGNLLGRWSHKTNERSDASLQVYYDRTDRSQPSFSEVRDTLDLDFRQRVRLAARNELVWGAGYRLTSGRTGGVPTVQVVPEDRTDDVWSAFVQDEIQIVPSRWALTFGSKFERNDYSGFNVQPNVRLLFTPASRYVLWSAISRALRVPSRIESDLEVTALLEPTTPTFIRVIGNRDFEPERLTAYELGLRAQATDRLFLDVALFENDYARLLSLEPGAPFGEPTPPPAHTVIPLLFGNKIGADVRGGELGWDWRPLPAWRLAGSYSYLHMDVRPDPDSLDTTTEASTEGSSPHHMASLRSYLDLPRNFSLDLTLRHVGRLPSQNVDAYTELDAMFGRRLAHGFELSVAGQNLLSAHHAEFGGGVEIQRSIYGRLIRRW